MSATFPQLLRRSAFVQHDPLITRVYASNPTSQRIGDWGFKFPIYRSSHGRHLKIVGSLDAGPGIRTQWETAERETRLVQMWGDGRVPWTKKGERAVMPQRPSLQHNSHNSFIAEELATPPPAPVILPNVEAMTEAQFQKYLEYIRSRRDELREQLYSEPESGAGTPAEDATLPYAALKFAVETTPADFQAAITAKDMSEPTSRRLHGRPHKLHGLAYSSAPAASASMDPSRVHKGRVLDTVTSIRRSPSGGYRRPTDTNNEFVVGIGGVTALGGSGVSRISDKARLSEFDYTRERPQKGIADFRITEAVLEDPPTVLGLNGQGSSGARWLRERVGAMYRARPLTSFQFDIKVDEESDPDRPEPGSAKWVSREPAAAPVGKEGSLGVLGGPKAARPRGAGHEATRRMTRNEQAAAIDSLFAKLSGKK